MTSEPQLLRAVEQCEIPHLFFRQHFEPLKQRIENALAGRASRIERVVGPSRAGKSMLINSLKRAFPESNVDGRRFVPLLVVPLPSAVSSLELPSSVIDALGLPVQRNVTAPAQGRRMLKQLELARTRVMLFEEASHIVEANSRMPARAAGDWFKALADSLDATLVFFGVPRLEQLFKQNEQLRLRASATRALLPYDSRIPLPPTLLSAP